MEASEDANQPGVFFLPVLSTYFLLFFSFLFSITVQKLKYQVYKEAVLCIAEVRSTISLPFKGT